MNLGESVAGVTHPFTHVGVAVPRVGGGDAGGLGGETSVGDAAVPVGEMTDDDAGCSTWGVL